MLLATLSSKYQGICWNCCYFSESKKLHFFPFFRSYSGYLLKLAYVRFSNPSQYLLIMIVMILATSTFNLIETWYILERSLLIMIHDSNNQLFERDRNLEYSRAQFCDVERQDLFSSIHLVLRSSFTWSLLGFSQCRFDQMYFIGGQNKHTKTPPHQFLLLPCRLQHSRSPPSSSDYWGTWGLSFVDNLELEFEILFSTPFGSTLDSGFGVSLRFYLLCLFVERCFEHGQHVVKCEKRWVIFFVLRLFFSVLASLWVTL